MTDSERIKALELHLNLSTRALALSCGIKTIQTLYDIHKGKHGISKQVADKISAKYLNINKTWLLTGEGQMLYETTSKKEEPSAIFNSKIFLVPLISKYAYAGYLAGYGDPEYIDQLPQTPWLIPEETVNPKGQYYSFEVRGDSMTDGSNESVEDGDVVLCRLINPSLYQNCKLHYKKWNFVIVHKTEGVIIKRIIDHDVERGAITIHSLNPEYADRTIFLNDVAQIFNVVQLQRKPIL